MTWVGKFQELTRTEDYPIRLENPIYPNMNCDPIHKVGFGFFNNRVSQPKLQCRTWMFTLFFPLYDHLSSHFTHIEMYPSHGHHHLNQVTPNQHGATRVPPGKQRVADMVQLPGSRLPDCTHTCGSCS
ncbi:hypothetical protein Hanom_Chr12g01121861 [Helianthus anomalus]